MAGGVVSAHKEQTAGLQWLDRLLVLLRSWQLLAVCCAILLLLLFASLLLPQLPGQVSEDPVATARWLQEWRPASGPLGGLWRSLGLYTVLNSPLFQATAAFLLILALVHLADSAALILALHRLPGVLHMPIDASAQAAPIVFPRQLFRLRSVSPQPPAVVSGDVEHALAAQTGRLFRATLDAKTRPLAGSPITDSPTADPAPVALVTGAADVNETNDSTQEQRWLLLRHARSAWLRALLFGGLALALLSLWLAARQGWSVTPPPLAPGESYAYAPHELLLEYGVHPAGETTQARAVLTATVAGQSITLSVGGDQGGRTGGADVRINQGPPALWVAAPDALLLAPGSLPDEARRGLGLLFPQPGGEQVVVLANGNAGLRIVRLANADADAPDYLVEVYEEGNAQPAQRLQIAGAARVVVGEGHAPTELELTPTVGIQVEVSRRPGLWLLWLALLMVAAGALGFLRRPGFVLAQLAPWPVERSVLIVQSDRPTEIPVNGP